MDTLGDLTMNELLELARIAQHKRHLHNEAMKKYQNKNIDKFREIWRNQTIRTIDPGSFLRQDPELVTTISILSSRYQLGLLTNNNRVHTDRILEILGVGPFFQAILTVSETGKTKPDPTLCSIMACLLDVLPEKCLVIGDEESIDLIPARAIGMKTYHIRHVSDVHRLRELFPSRHVTLNVPITSR